MIKLKHFIVPIILIVVIIVFKIQSIFSAPNNENSIETLPVESKPELPADIKESIIEYDSTLSNEIKNAGTIGAAVVITYKNQIAFLKCYGVKKASEIDSINKNTIFRLASVSKTVSGVLAGILDDENAINLDDKIIEYIPGFQLKDSVNTFDLSIRNILSHTSGLVPHAYDNLVEAQVPLSKIMNDLNEVEISAEPGKLYGYQNVMFSLFDTIVHAKTSRSFNLLIREKVFDPFGMNNASTGFEPFSNSKNKAFPHSGVYGSYHTLQLNNRYYTTTPAAGVNASISDMGNFLLTLLNNNEVAISNAAKNEIFKPNIYTPLKLKYLKNWDKVDSRHYGIGWRIIGYKNRKIAYHGGYVEGYRAEIALCRNENIGIAYLTNSPNKVASMAIPFFLNLYFNLEDQIEN